MCVCEAIAVSSMSSLIHRATPMSREKQNARKFTVKVTRGSMKGRHEINRVKGTVSINSTVVTYLVIREASLSGRCV